MERKLKRREDFYDQYYEQQPKNLNTGGNAD